MKPLDAAKWIRHFLANRRNRPEPEWELPVRLSPELIRTLRPSMEQFQLGDGGGPASLIAHDAQKYRNSSEATRRIVDFWFEEEREHSRLLGQAVKRLNGKRIETHWSFSAFCACRRIIGVRAELQILLLTELVSTAYYTVLRRHVDDLPIKQMCSLILRDEAGHVAFHRDRLAACDNERGIFWALQFWLCGYAAATMLWINHGPCLRPFGARTKEYYHEVRFQISRFIRRLYHLQFVSHGDKTTIANVTLVPRATA